MLPSAADAEAIQQEKENKECCPDIFTVQATSRRNTSKQERSCCQQSQQAQSPQASIAACCRCGTIWASKAKQSKATTIDDTECIVRCEPYANSKSRETWVQCLGSKKWAHNACTAGDPYYVCHNCDSDSD